MMKIQRLPAPDLLLQNFQKWAKRYKERRDINIKARFYWNRGIDKLILPILMLMTQEHCSFCDGFPIETTGDSIEHFRPKAQFPLLSYNWENLFYCCDKCQISKLETFDEKLLKPDEVDYYYENYFIYDTKTGNLEPKPECSDEDKQKALKTIELYGLNEHGRPKARKRTLKYYKAKYNKADFPYRFILP